MAENYVATEALFIGRARAHNPGDVVPAAHVEKYGWADMVAKQGTKAAKRVETPDTTAGPAAGKK